MWAILCDVLCTQCIENRCFISVHCVGIASSIRYSCNDNTVALLSRVYSLSLSLQSQHFVHTQAEKVICNQSILIECQQNSNTYCCAS